jgi:ribosome-binding protein aMBF1 (putative translation factor)
MLGLYVDSCSSKAQKPPYSGNYPPIVLHPAGTLGQHIKKSRLEQGLFQVDLAKRIGVSEMTIVNREKGRTKPTGKNWERLEIILRDSKD